jgi:hypothetical protein
MDDEEVEVIEQKAYPDEEDAKQRQQALEQLTQQCSRPGGGATGSGSGPASLHPDQGAD